MGLTVVRRRLLVPELKGWLEFFERTEGEREWRKVLEVENIVLNGFYNDLIAVMQGISINLGINALALGTGATAPARTDSHLTTEWVSGANTTPQRMSVTATSALTTDPPQGTWSFYLPAAANTVSFSFAEAGLLYDASSLTPGDLASSRFATHALFAYTKAVNTDLRIDYTLARTLT